MSKIDLEASRSVRYAVPLITVPHRFWPEPSQLGWCWFLAVVIVAELVTIGRQLWRYL